MTAQVLFFNAFSEKDPHLNVFEETSCMSNGKGIIIHLLAGSIKVI